MLEKLAKVQAPEDELRQYTTLAAIQTKGLKRHFTELDKGVKEKKPKLESLAEDEVVVNSIRGAKQKRIALLGSNENEDENERAFDPNVVGLNVNIKVFLPFSDTKRFIFRCYRI